MFSNIALSIRHSVVDVAGRVLYGFHYGQMRRQRPSVALVCPGCGIGINIDTSRLTDAAEEMHTALEKVPSEITIKFYR